MATFASKKAAVHTVQTEAAQEEHVSTTKSLLDRVSNQLKNFKFTKPHGSSTLDLNYVEKMKIFLY